MANDNRLDSENDITDIIDETFTTTEERFGEMVTIELKPGGEEVPVTEENKKEYVDCVVEYRISKRVKEQFDAFMSGFSELIPHDLITVFDERELELLIGGMSEIDVYVLSPSLSSTPPFLLDIDADAPILIRSTATTGPNSRITEDTKLRTRSSSGSGSVCGAGPPSESRVSCSSPRVLRVFQSTASRICKARMDQGGLRLRSRETLRNFRRVILASTGSTCRRIRIMRPSSRS